MKIDKQKLYTLKDERNQALEAADAALDAGNLEEYDARLEEIKGQPLSQLNIVGGGIQNKLLNQMAADSIDRPVVTGPVEGAAMGNLLAQAMALGEVRDVAHLRQIVRNSENVEPYAPNPTAQWEDAYQKLLALL